MPRAVAFTDISSRPVITRGSPASLVAVTVATPKVSSRRDIPTASRVIGYNSILSMTALL